MRNASTALSNAWGAAALVLLATGATLPAQAGQVLLESKDGGVSIRGEFVAVEDGAYVLESTFGTVRILIDDVTCVGAHCPEITETFRDAEDDAAEIVTWNVSLWGKRRAFTEHVERLAELVSEKTDGAFTLDLHYGGLAPSRENLEGIAAGKFEMAQFCASYHPEKTPSITVLELPFLGVDSLEMETALSLAVYDHPAVVADLARWNATLLMPSPQPQKNIMGVGQPPMSLGAFRDMAIRSTGGVGRAIEALGAEPVNIPATGVRDALTDGTVQAVAMAPHAHMAFGTLEGGSWWTTNLNPGAGNCPVVANSEALDALSPSNRIALTTSLDEALQHYVDHYNGATMDAWGPALEERMIIELTFSEAIVAAIHEEVAAPAAAAWIADNEARGLPADELYALVRGIIARGS